MGAYPMIDWAAVFDEEYLAHGTGTVKFNNEDTSNNAVGLSPHVSAIMTTFDGGKIMVGFGLFDNTTHFGWVIKLFGADPLSANYECGQYDIPVRYTEMETKNKITTATG